MRRFWNYMNEPFETTAFTQVIVGVVVTVFTLVVHRMVEH